MYGACFVSLMLSAMAVPTIWAASAEQPAELTNLTVYQGMGHRDLAQALPDGRWIIRSTPGGTLLSIRNADRLVSPDKLLRRGRGSLAKRAAVSCTGSYLSQVDLATAAVNLGVWCNNGGAITGVTGEAQTSGNAVVAVCNDSVNQQYCAEQEIWNAWTVIGQFCSSMETGWWYDGQWDKGYAFDVIANEAGLCNKPMR